MEIATPLGTTATAAATENDLHVSVENADDENYDAASALLLRGAFLKKLRELERQDEEERQRMASFREEEDEKEEESSTLKYSRYLANQRGVYDDYKHVNYEFIEFDGANSQSLTIQQDRTVGKGTSDLDVRTQYAAWKEYMTVAGA